MRLRNVSVLGGIFAAVAVSAFLACADSEPKLFYGTEGGPPTDATAADARGGDGGGDAGDATAPLVSSCKGKGTVTGVWLADPHLCLELFASGLPAARQMAFAPNGDLFVEYGGGSIAVLFDYNGDGEIAGPEKQVFATAPGLSHGVAFSPDGAWLYASSDTTIWRWAYKKGDLVASGAPEVVVKNMPAAGHHTRTLVFDAQGRLYVNVGSAGNVDESGLDERALVRRFGIPNPIPAGGMDYAVGEIFASGLRNEVGLAFDPQGRLWGVENGLDGLTDDELGAIANENPAEEINRLDGPGARFYGFPWCWTEFSIPDGGMGPGTQWRLDGISMPNRKTDAWCRDTMNVHPPAFAMQAHAAPLGITYYGGRSLPWKGDLFVAQHGSSYRTPPVGRLVGRAHLVGDTIQSFEPVVGKDDGAGNLEQGTWDARPVDVREGPDGALYFSDDLGGRVFRLGWRP